VHKQGAAERSVVDERFELDVFVVEAAHEADLDELHAGFSLAPDEFEGTRGIGGERLFAEHRLARFEAGQDLLLVGGAGRGEHDRIDIVGGDRVEGVQHHPRTGCGGCDLLGALSREVVDHADAGATDGGGEPGDVVGAHEPDAEDGDTQILVISHDDESLEV